MAVLGFLLIAAATIDPLWTTLWVDGHAAPLTGRFNSLTRRVIETAAGKRHTLLSLSGPIVLVSTVLYWAVLLWTGWVLLFSADSRSLLHTQSGIPAGIVDRIYFTGYALVTLGNGDLSPNGNVWELATSITSFSGLFLLTLSVTYLLAVIGAVVQKRSFASQVWALGHTAEQFVLNSWDGTRFPAVELQLTSLTEQLGQVTEQHQAYPMLHYYHESRQKVSVAVNLAILDDALTILSLSVAPDVRPAPSALHSARATVEAFLETLKDAFISPSTDSPPGPDLATLRFGGIPLLRDEEFAAVLAECQQRRRLLCGFLEAEQREWPQQRR